MTTYTQTVSDILCLGDVNSQYKKFYNGKDGFCLVDVRYNNINKYKIDIFSLNDFKYKNTKKYEVDNFYFKDFKYKNINKYKNDNLYLNDVKYKNINKYKTDNFCLKGINYKNIIKYKIENFYLVDVKNKNVNKYKTDNFSLNDVKLKYINRYFNDMFCLIESKIIGKIKNDTIYLTDIQSNIYYKAFVNVIIDTLTRAGIPAIYGQNVKTVDYARWDGVIVRQEEISRDTTYISSYYYNKLSFHLIVVSKNRNNYFAYLDAVRQLPLAVKENPYGAVSVVLKPVSGRFDYNVRGIYREEFVLEIQLLY